MTKVDAADYAEFAAKLKAADKAVARGIRKALRTSTRDLGKTVLREGSEPMPARGGLRDKLANSSAATLSLTATRAGLTLRNKGVALRSINTGVLRHPLFGMRRHWYSQTVPAGTYDEAFDRRRDEIASAFGDALDEAMGELT